MPQPYKGRLVTSDVKVMLERPELATHIAYIASIWSRIDVGMGLLFSVIAGMEYKIGLDIYLELKSVRLDALMAIVEGRVNPEFEKSLTELRKEYRARATERNRIVHGIWCISEDEPEALIYAGESDYIEMYSHMWRPEVNDEDEMKPWPSPAYMIYKKKDFEEIEGRLFNFLGTLNQLRNDISIRRQIDEERKELSALFRVP